ncbi:MAG: nicotinamide mononucleotide transporter [Planctomycetota bacterium]|nr:MAG: nicotinamide mononucleotide transporter [Planctomycetota bacterium]
MTALDYSADVLGAVYLLITLRFNLWKWPAGVIHCAVFGVLFWMFKLYEVSIDPAHPDAGRVESVGVVFGLICVILTVRRNIWSWPTGIVNIVFSVFMFWWAGLYADVVNMFVMFVLSLYGWYGWLHGRKDDGPLVVETASPRLRAGSVLLVAALSPVVGWILSRLPGVSYPYWDSFILVASLVAQWGLARKYVENWVLWICVDLVAIPLYARKELRAASGLYVIFLILATCGLIEWMRALKKKKSAAA